MLDCRIISPQEKIFSDTEPKCENVNISILKGETASFQVAVKALGTVKLSVEAPGFVSKVRRVVEVPVTVPIWPDCEDDDYLRREPGLFPDLLREVDESGKAKVCGWWRAFWVDLEPEENTPSGQYRANVTVSLLDWNGELSETVTRTVPVCYTAVALPPQKLKHTKWFYCDCLADYYGVEAFSEAHWAIVENFVRSAAKMGVNMLLTPLFTPPLDTYVGGERTTVQLIGVRRDGGKYSFDFSALERWVKMCLECGIEYFEMSHLYTQWGATSAPKVMATVDGEYRRLFGWETPAIGGEYAEFLSCFLPELAGELHRLGIADRCRFHVSDEPHEDHLDHYTAVRDQAKKYLPGFKFMDALSNYEFYDAGAVDCPVPASDSGDLPKFLAGNVPDLGIYYCCGQTKDVSNVFIAMPFQRTRILGLQLYVYDLKVFLQWGFNFYNAQVSRYRINPYAVTDADEAFPAGDPFVVYPGANGVPEESLRYAAMRQAMHDLRALQLLESLSDREFVLDLIRTEAGGEITLTDYPRDLEFLPCLRARVNAEIAARS